MFAQQMTRGSVRVKEFPEYHAYQRVQILLWFSEKEVKNQDSLIASKGLKLNDP